MTADELENEWRNNPRIQSRYKQGRLILLASGAGAETYKYQPEDRVVAINRAIICAGQTHVPVDVWLFRDTLAWEWAALGTWQDLCTRSGAYIKPTGIFINHDSWRPLSTSGLTICYFPPLMRVLGYRTAIAYGVTWTGTSDWDGFNAEDRDTDRWAREPKHLLEACRICNVSILGLPSPP